MISATYRVMEESNEVHSEENKVSPEKNKKRTLKTPAQVLALEKFYEDHKYPTEEMKSQLAGQIGLTEKQISGWFCHRRLKDKNSLKDEACANGRQDRSSGVVLQDRGSGLRQDSCGSTKQGEYRHVDPREVESQRFYDQEIPAVNLAHDSRNNHYSGTVGGVDDTCSESTSASQDGLYCPRMDPYDLETSKILTKNGAIIPNNAMGSKKIPYKPSGFLKVKGDVENAAITAVKRALGRHYQEDGPPLGVDFQPLPPGAFESPIGKPVHEPYANGEPALLYSPDVFGVQKHPSLSTSIHMEGSNSGTIRGFDRHENKSHSQFKRKSHFHNITNPFTGCNSSFDTFEDSAGKTSVHNIKNNDRMIFNCGKEGARSDSISNHHLAAYGGRIANEQTDCWLNNYDNVSRKPVQRSEHLKAKPPNLTFAGSESVDTEERGPYRRMPKDQTSFGERKRSKEYQDPIRQKKHQTKDAKRAREDLPPRDYAMKPSFAERPSCPSQIKGSAIEMPSSFSEDETAETSSSLD